VNHSVKSGVEYVVFAIGIFLGLGICLLPLLVHYGFAPESLLFAGGFTPFFGVAVLVGTMGWGIWAHNRCKKGVCDIK
jgi:hypothetical protein